MEDIKDVWELVEKCGPEAVAAVDGLGYRFLADNGYPEVADKLTPTMRDAIRKKMHKRNEHFHIRHRYDGDRGAVIVWYNLTRGNRRVIAVSDRLVLQGRPLDAPVPYGKEGEV